MTIIEITPGSTPSAAPRPSPATQPTAPSAAGPSPEKRRRVVVADDHNVVCLGLAGAIARAGAGVGLTVVGTVATAAALRRWRSTDCDVVVLDLNLSDGSEPADTVAWLTAAGIRTLVYTVADDPPLIRQALAAGAHGISRKSEPLVDTVRKLRRVADGEVLVTPDILAAIDGDAAFVADMLSTREKEVLVLFVSGWDIPRIARRIYVTEHTVKEYLRRVRQKYGEARRPAPTRVDLLRRAIEDGIVPPIQPRSRPDV